MSEKKPAVDNSGLDVGARERLDSKIDNFGTFNSRLVEAIPNFKQSDSEFVYSNPNNSWLVLGRDRPGPLQSGYGGRGDTQAAAIDICCGRMSYNPSSKAWVDPDFKVDAARIYISQKTDVDANFGISEGMVGSFLPFERPGSAVAMKADAVRVMARDGGIKLVTGMDRINSQGGQTSGGNYIGIDLIAGNDDSDMQPLVRGDNMSKCIKELNSDLQELAGIVQNLALEVQSLANAVTGHYHISPTYGGPTSNDFILDAWASFTSAKIQSLVATNLHTFTLNRGTFRHKYLNKATGKFYINSEHNHTN